MNKISAKNNNNKKKTNLLQNNNTVSKNYVNLLSVLQMKTCNNTE